jgi:hypothetical protein
LKEARARSVGSLSKRQIEVFGQSSYCIVPSSGEFFRSNQLFSGEKTDVPRIGYQDVLISVFHGFEDYLLGASFQTHQEPQDLLPSEIYLPEDVVKPDGSRPQISGKSEEAFAIQS